MLYEFNHKPYQKKDGSRALAFEEEKLLLLPPPPRPFELATCKIATVALNYHIPVDKMNYSAPYEYIKQKMDVRITRSTIEVFFDGNRICSHRMPYGRTNQYSTVEEHMSPNHQQYVHNGTENGSVSGLKRLGSTHKQLSLLFSSATRSSNRATRPVWGC